MFVQVGQQVKAGQQIAEVGNRGQSTGPHLHLEIWDEDGNKLNPIPWLVNHGITFPGVSSARSAPGGRPQIDLHRPRPLQPQRPVGSVRQLGVLAVDQLVRRAPSAPRHPAWKSTRT